LKIKKAQNKKASFEIYATHYKIRITCGDSLKLPAYGRQAL